MGSTERRGLSVLQPWASFLVVPAPSGRSWKTYETRSWSTPYRGQVAICASVGRQGILAFRRDPALWATACDALGVPDLEMLPRGKVVGTARIQEVIPTAGGRGIDAIERSLGDWTAGRWAWEMGGVKPLATPVPIRGRLGLFRLTPGEIEAVRLGMVVQPVPGCDGAEMMPVEVAHG